jgi:hypothetical protein
MPVFSNQQMNSMCEALKGMVSTYAAKTALTLTQEEFIASFINLEHIEFLQHVRELVGAISTSNDFRFTHYGTEPVPLALDGTSVPLVMGVTGNCPNGLPILIPKYTSGGFQPTAPEAVKEKFATWAADRRRIGLAAGVGFCALRWLSQTCGNAKAVSVMFPAATTLLARMDDNGRDGESTGKNQAKAQKVASSKYIGELPAIPPALRRLIYEASQVINALTLVVDAPDVVAPKHGAYFWMTSSAHHPDVMSLMSEHMGSHPGFI